MQNEEKSQQKDEQALLSIGKASEYLGVSIDTLRRWEKRGRLVAFRSPGGHRYFQKEKLNDFFNQKYVREPKPTVPKPTDVELPPPPTERQEKPGQPQAPVPETIFIPRTSPTVLENHPEKPTPPAAEEVVKEEKPQVKTHEQLLKSIFDTPQMRKGN